MGWPDAMVAAVATASLAALIGVIVVSIMNVGQASVITQGSKDKDQFLRALAEETTAAQRRVADELTEIRISMADMRDRVGTVERAIQEVG